ncbi:nuclear transport factor 2 family protein [Halosimplex litoreum]|uniref:Nuclear transport factor 2 family protein n=1 Tax=Halosimplex litoreum TaxID=1198301 RepID=A0A7T3FWE1_9EURY|nr:nuclear transport factor 2 family protein [Halosimplex litoreum]QPV61508.1 nuclear transport factor 2 family protein [Halosimplex litoreum]
MTDGAERARAYYRALDQGEYDALTALLAPEFVHDRPDMRLEGRERFVEFVREERPQTDTDHRVEAVFAVREDTESRDGEAGGSIAVQGRLLAADGSVITGFVDVFSLDDAGIDRIETYTD